MKEKSRNIYFWPELKDKSVVSLKDIVKKLKPPRLIATRRSVAFKFEFEV